MLLLPGQKVSLLINLPIFLILLVFFSSFLVFSSIFAKLTFFLLMFSFYLFFSVARSFMNPTATLTLSLHHSPGAHRRSIRLLYQIFSLSLSASVISSLCCSLPLAAVSVRSKISAPKKRNNKRKSVEVGINMNERVDQVLESCIEVESNRRLLDENLNYLTLTFKDPKMERNVSMFSIIKALIIKIFWLENPLFRI